LEKGKPEKRETGLTHSIQRIGYKQMEVGKTKTTRIWSVLAKPPRVQGSGQSSKDQKKKCSQLVGKKGGNEMLP